MHRPKRQLPIACILVMASLLLIDGIAYAQPSNQVALVVQYGDGTLFTRCVDFSEGQITGLDVLQRAGLGLVYASGGGGAEVCKIGPDGCDDPGNCFCQCKGKDCQYWSYWHLVDGAWRYSPFGASLYKVEHGAVEGWVWGIGTPTDAPQPPAIAFEKVCVPPTPTPAPTVTPLPTASPTQPPKATSMPTSTLSATATPTSLPPTTTPEPAPTDAPEPEPVLGMGWTSYLAFGGIVVVLVVVGVVLLRKR